MICSNCGELDLRGQIIVIPEDRSYAWAAGILEVEHFMMTGCRGSVDPANLDEWFALCRALSIP